MKIIKYITLSVMLTVLLPLSAGAKTIVKPKGYLFGFVANFTDSVVYFTDIQAVDSIWYDTGKRFLLGRDVYANQLRTYFSETLKMPHRTCVVCFGLTRKKAEQKLVKMRKIYTAVPKKKKTSGYDVRNLNENEFRFTTVNMSEYAQQEAPLSSADKKAKRKADKEAEKQAKAKAKEARKAQKEARKAKEAEEESKKPKGKKVKKDRPAPRPLNPNLPPAEVEMKDN